MDYGRRAKSHGWRAAAASVLLAVLALVAILAGCGSDDGASAAKPSAGPSAFADESYAELATDGQENLWLAVSGYRRNGDFGLRVFKREGSGWAELPTPPGEVSGDIPISFVVADKGGEATPCLGYSIGVSRKPVITCLRGDAWHPRDLPRLRGVQLQQIGVEEGTLIALLAKRKGFETLYRLVRETDAGWTVSPAAAAPAAIARLATEPSSSAAGSPAIGLATQGRVSNHYVMELRRGQWRKLRPDIEGVGTGPLIGGPIIFPRRILYPVTEADTEPWSFSVQAAQAGSQEARERRLSTGDGNAQGQLHLVDNRLWATWQEDDPRKDGRFRAAIYAAELTPTGKIRRKIRLWRGLSIGPGSTQVVEFQEKTLALYMRSSSNGRGLQATVKALSR